MKTIDKTIRHILGNRNARIVYNYLEKESCPMREIPTKLDLFSVLLRNLLGVGRGRILGAPTILEDAIIETLSAELGLKLARKPVTFEDGIRRLKERYNKQRSKPSPTMHDGYP